MNIALIGGIGSGKSEVLKVAREMGIAALSADEINAGLLKSPEYIEKIAAAFPGCVVCGVVDKARLASEVFSDKGKREKLRKVAECKESPLVVELPLVLESGMAGMFDEIILVSAPRRARMARLAGRGVEPARARAIMRAQKPVFRLRSVATRVIDNSGSLEDLRASARDVLRIFCE